ncbi:MAG: RagB/SusD family nutrient uptake outer membrane protein [Tannerella sp.]|jgi:hypothetical protein|nr:RagB/SusD family nutrient uptake outer membrane protein [Tannerella sp.]
MKKRFLNFMALTAISVCLVSLQSCDKDDAEEAGSVITTEVVKTDAEAETLGNAVYGPLQRLSSSFTWLTEVPTEHAISFEAAEDNGGPIISRINISSVNGVQPAHDYVDKIFQRLYESVGNSNIAIDKLDSSRVTDKLHQEIKDIVKARVKLTRALSYLALVQLYGEVPLILSTSNKPTERASIDAVYTQIVKDLTEAEEFLPPFDHYKFVPSKGAANALLARTYLVWASKPLSSAEVDAIKNNTGDPAAPQWDNAKLQKAVEYADKVINSGYYKLLDDFNRNFDLGGEDGDEHIFTIKHEGDGIDAQGNHQTHCTFTNAFGGREQGAVDVHVNPADEKYYTSDNFFVPGDKRKLLSIITRLFRSDEGNKEYSFAFPEVAPAFGKWIHRGGYATTGTSPTIERANGVSAVAHQNNINRIEIRYAEVLLIKAEALLWLGRASEGLPLINQIRTRAGVPALNALTKEDLYREWELELFFEQKHWTNSVRWRTLISNVKKVKDFEYYKEIYKDEASIRAAFPEYPDINASLFAHIYSHLHSKYDNIKGRNYRFPIPQTSGITNLGITVQNPGY